MTNSEPGPWVVNPVPISHVQGCRPRCYGQRGAIGNRAVVIYRECRAVGVDAADRCIRRNNSARNAQWQPGRSVVKQT